MAVLGAGFCVVLAYARVKRLPGGCGCIQWRAAPKAAAWAVSWREIARAAVLTGAGVSEAISPAYRTGAVHPAWFAAGIVAGAAVLVALSVPGLARTPVCHRRLWLPARATLRALTTHAVFAAMAESAGPLGPVVRQGRAGCTDEFWFPVTTEAGGDRFVVFQVRHQGPRENLAVKASVRNIGATLRVSCRHISQTTAGRQGSDDERNLSHEVRGGMPLRRALCRWRRRRDHPGRGGVRAHPGSVRERASGAKRSAGVKHASAIQLGAVEHPGGGHAWRVGGRCCLYHGPAEDSHHAHRCARRPGRRLPQVHQRQRYYVPDGRLACGRGADRGRGGHRPQARAVDHVRRLAGSEPAACVEAATRRFGIRGRRRGRPARWVSQRLSSPFRAAPRECAWKLGQRGGFRVAARRWDLPSVLSGGQRLAERRGLCDHPALEPAALTRGWMTPRACPVLSP
jgi:hypothetical protein